MNDIKFITQIVTLTNGVRVANFSSPHTFTFEDDTVLPAYDDADFVNSLKLDVNERTMLAGLKNGNQYKSIKIAFRLTDPVITRLHEFQMMYMQGEIDIVIVPLPVQQLIPSLYLINQTPFRTVRMVDRVNKIASIDTFCI
jgi:hypothetical protein